MMASPPIMRAASVASDLSTSTQSCIAVKPMRDSSPPSDGSQVASSTPPTSVNPTPSIASDQARSSPKRSVAEMNEVEEASRKSTRRRSSKQGASGKILKTVHTPATASKADGKRGTGHNTQKKQGNQSASKVTVKGVNYFSLQSWLSQSQQRVQPSIETSTTAVTDDKEGSSAQSHGLKRKRQSNASTPEVTQLESRHRKAELQSETSTAAEEDSPDGGASAVPLASGSPVASTSDTENQPSAKRAKRSGSSSKADGRNTKQNIASAVAAKATTAAARARNLVTAARRSARDVAAKAASMTTKKPEKSKAVSADPKESRSARRSTRDVNAAPSNEEKAATALQQDSKKMQNKQMMTKGKFSTGPVDEIMPLPNNWFIGKFGGTNDTYLKDFKTARGFKLGAEIFNPQPGSFVREGKDWAVTKGAKNVFAGNARATWAKSDFANLPQSFCNCKASDACGVDCWNRTMEYECNDNNCAVGAALCKNRPFAGLIKRLEKAEAVNNRQKEQERVRAEEEKRRPQYASVAMSFDQGVEVFQAAGKGYGVRAQRSFEPDQIIMEYFGEIIDQDEVEKRMATTYKDSTDFYMMQFHDGFILDATKGSMARFVNHACEPNCEIRKMLVSTASGKKASVEPRMALFAGKNGIQFNEELTYDYNFDPFSTRNVQKCLCGSSNCRGFLGPRPPKERSQANVNGVSSVKEKITTKVKAEVAKATTVTKTKSGVLATSSILKAAKRARF